MQFFTDLTPLIQDVTLALTGAAAGSALVWLARRLNNMAAERKYSISGEYKAEYHDTVDSERKIQGGTVTLKQKGLHVNGEHFDPESNRSWRLTGEIDKNTGHMFGYYKARSHLDSGLGVFIFEQLTTETLEGIWAGYDSKNRNINQGGYTLTKRLPIHIRRAKKKDIIKILHLACNTLGDGYISDQDLLDHLEKSYVYVALHQKKIIGFALCRTIPKNGLMTELKNNKYTLPSDLKMANRNGTIGLLQSIATDPQFQGKGVGRRLVDRCLSALERAGAKQVLSVGWKTDTIHIGTVLSSCGFAERKTFKAFWKDESLQKQYDCPQCGTPPCECEAVLFSRT